jgi:AcrR family transcriptional regulator
MNDIAAAAGVSRQTLYNEFGTRNELGLAFVLHEAGSFLGGVESAIRAKADDPHGAIEVALEQFLVVAGQDPVIAVLLSDDGTGGMLPFVTNRAMPMITWVSNRIGAVIVETWPGMNEDDAGLIAENLVRLAISYVTAPVDQREVTVARVSRLISPFVDRALAGSN